MAMSAKTRKIGYSSRQLPNCSEAQLARIGAMNEAMALTHCPK